MTKTPKIISYNSEELLKQNIDKGVRKDILQKQAWEIYLSKHKVDALHYMVHRRNIDSILMRGILSFNRISEVYQGHERIDDIEVQWKREHKRLSNGKSIHDYVPLYFCTQTAMQRVVTHRTVKRNDVVKPSDIVFVDISLNVFLQQGVYFSQGNAASGATEFFNKPEELDKLNWSGMRINPKEFKLGEKEWYRIRMAEVLVPDVIAPGFFTRLVCLSSKLRVELNDLVKKYGLNIPVVTDAAKVKYIGPVPKIEMEYYFDDDLEVPE